MSGAAASANPPGLGAWLSQLQAGEIPETESMLNSKLQFRSASRLWLDQFLLFRVLWQPSESRIPLSELIPDQIIEQSISLLETNPAWQRYLGALPGPKEKRTAEKNDIGLFSIVRWQQLAINSEDFDDQTISSSITPTKRLLERLPESERAEALGGYFFRDLPHKSFYESPGSRGDNRSSSESYHPRSSESEKSSSPNQKPGRLAEKTKTNSPGASISSESSRSPDQQPVRDVERRETRRTFRSNRFENIDSLIEGEQGRQTSELKPAGDEQIVNVALVSLLDAVMISSPAHYLETTSERKRFRYSDLWTAVTDGYLRRLDDPDSIHAIIEVKAAPRVLCRKQVQRQEAGEMVAWIYDGMEDGEQRLLEGPGYWRLLIAQDKDELWVVVARYEDLYKEYIRKGQVPGTLQEASFMKMTEYGPFCVSVKEDVQAFGVFIQAFCLLRGNDVRKDPNEGLPIWRGGDEGSFTRRLREMNLSDRESHQLPSSGPSDLEVPDSPTRGRRRR